MKDVTFCLGTILRDESLYRCVESIRESYPDSPIAVADDGHHSGAKTRKMGSLKVDYHKLPFDMGLSYKRNTLVHRVTTPHVAVVDDDMVITREAQVDKLRRFMPFADLAAGKVRLGSGRELEYVARLHLKNRVLLMRELRSPWEDGWRRTHLALNCYVAKTEVLKAIGWDNRFKTTYEHLDFFLRMRLAGRFVAYVPDAVFHETRARNEEYLKYRGRHEIAKAIFFRKWNLSHIQKDHSLMTNAERRAAT